jgi:hypothetical protein
LTQLTALLLALASPPASATLLQAEPSGLYRSHFDQGLAELAAGSNEAAAESFAAAGKLAPDAPVWKAYLDRAEGRELVLDFDGTRSGFRPWSLAPPLSADARFDASGERLVSRSDPATLWDALSGEPIACVRGRTPHGGRQWMLDTTGRILVGLGRSADHQRLVCGGIDLRDARTGEPIEVDGASSIGLRWDTRFEWVPQGSEIASSARAHTFQIALPDGYLRCTTPTTENSLYVVRPDGTRAVSLSHELESMLALVDPRDGSTLLRIRPGGHQAIFSGSGRFLATKDRDRILLVDADRGEPLASPQVPERGQSNAFHCAFDGEQLVVADRWGRCIWWDPELTREVRNVQLDPPPGGGFQGLSMACGGSRILAQVESTIQCYDATSGAMHWSHASTSRGFEGLLASDDKRLLVRTCDGSNRIVDVASGATRVSLDDEVAVQNLEPLQATQACVVATSDGALRRVDLSSGRTSAITQGSETGRWWTRSLDADRLIAWMEGEEVRLLDTATLGSTLAIELEEDERVLAVADDGSRAATVVSAERLRLRTIAESAGSIDVEGLDERPRYAAFSPDGSRIAASGTSKVWLIDSTTAATLAVLSSPDLPSPGPMAFYGADRLAVGWSGQDVVGVHLLQLPSGERLQRLDVSERCLFGGTVAELRCFPELERIAFSVDTFGLVAIFRAEAWQEPWLVDHAGRDLQRIDGSNRICVSGWHGPAARAIDLRTGSILAQASLEACFDLAGSHADRFLVGTRDGRMAVFSGETFEPLYVRSEGADGSAWIVRNGKELEVDGEAGWDTGARHLERGGLSHPADCWDAWILDPLGLVRAPLDALPDPPRIRSGPPRVVLAEGDAAELALEIESEEPLLGVQVEVEGRPTELTPIDSLSSGARFTSTLSVAAPWPAGVRVRAVARSGVLSSPWRVRVEPFR